MTDRAPSAMISLCLFLLLCPSGSAGQKLDPSVEQARRARDKGDIVSLQTLIRTARDETVGANAFESNLRVALFNSWLCEAARDHQDDRVVKQAAQEGVASADRAAKLNPESSEAHRLAGELLGQLIPHVFAGGMRYGAHSTSEIEKAMQLDPKNPNVYAARGLDYYFTPKTFGGDKNKAIEMFKRAIATDPISDAAGTAHIWLAKIYQSLGKNEEAASEIGEALRMNPGRLFAKLVQGQPAPK